MAAAVACGLCAPLTLIDTLIVAAPPLVDGLLIGVPVGTVGVL